MKTEIITFGPIADGEKPEISTKDVPVIHTETKTITYESSEVKTVKGNMLLFFCLCNFCIGFSLHHSHPGRESCICNNP